MTIERMDRTFAKSVAPKIESLQRRLFLKRSLSLGALTLLTGCNASTPDAMDRLLARMSKANDWIQGASSARPDLHRPMRKATSPGHSRSTPTMRKPRRR